MGPRGTELGRSNAESLVGFSRALFIFLFIYIRGLMFTQVVVPCAPGLSAKP